MGECVIFRPATQADFARFYGEAMPAAVTALVAVNGNDTPLAVGGYELFGRVALAFSAQREEMSKRDRVRMARALFDILIGTGLEVLADAGPHGDVALRHFGFERYGLAYRLPPVG